LRTRSCRTGTLIALSTVTVLALGACSSGGEAGTTKSGVPLVQAGTLVACTQLPYRPFEFNDASGKIVGFDIDVVTEVAKDLKVTPQIVDTPFEGIQTGGDLTAGKCDLAAAGITITAVREKAFDFSQPYFDATQALLVKTGSKVSSLKSGSPGPAMPITLMMGPVTGLAITSRTLTIASIGVRSLLVTPGRDSLAQS